MREVLEGPVPGGRVGNYRVERELGPTGSGILFEATHLVLPRKAILKIVHPAFAGVRQSALQLLREACILEAICHPGIPGVYESGILEDRRPWFALEAVVGPTLEALLALGPLPAEEVARLLRDLADILDHAHRRGVIHRGLRPDRVMITGARRFPLCIPDWSEAMTHDAASCVTQPISEDSGRYLAPELAQPATDLAPELVDPTHRLASLVDDRVDMFALGVIAFRALTGRLPAATGRAAAPRNATRASCATAPRALTSTIDSLLAIDRFDRPSAPEVRGEMDRWLSEPPVRVVVEPRRARRARWTPDVGYQEATEVDSAIADDVVAGRGLSRPAALPDGSAV